MRRWSPFFALLAAAAFVMVTTTPAAACGGLVAPDGAVRLDHTSTLAAYHNGIETYITSFEYNGGSANFGSIIPLPAAPTTVTRAGSWTLQRLEREVHPIPPTPLFAPAMPRRRFPRRRRWSSRQRSTPSTSPC